MQDLAATITIDVDQEYTETLSALISASAHSHQLKCGTNSAASIEAAINVDKAIQTALRRLSKLRMALNVE